MSQHQPFKFLRKWTEPRGFGEHAEPTLCCEYEASFWEGPERAGDTGRYVRRRVTDCVVCGGMLNTAPSVSYYSQLARACGL